MYFQWYRYCFSKYFTFQGRASRTEYWSFTIINLLILWVFWFISKLVDIPEEAMSEGIPVFPKDPVLALIFGSLYLIFCIAIFFPSLAVTVRRLHDRNHSGFWVIAQLIPLLNLVVLLMLLLPSSPYPNYYGLRAPRFPGEKIPEPGADIWSVRNCRLQTTIQWRRNSDTAKSEYAGKRFRHGRNHARKSC